MHIPGKTQLPITYNSNFDSISQESKQLVDYSMHACMHAQLSKLVLALPKNLNS